MIWNSALLAAAALLMPIAADAQEQLRLYCKTDTISYIGHVAPGDPWRGAVTEPGQGPDNLDYILRPLNPVDRSQRLELSADQGSPPTHRLFAGGSDLVLGWCRRTVGNPSWLTSQAPGADALGIDEGRMRFFRSSPGSYLSDGTAAATMELGRCSKI